MRRVLFLGSLLCVSSLVGVAVLERGAAEASSTALSFLKRVSTEVLGGADRYRTHLSLDKPIYRPGETLYARGTLLHASTHAPYAGSDSAMVQIKGPKGDVVANGYASLHNSIFAFAWMVPADAPGGEYLLALTFPGERQPPAERKFEVRDFRSPRLNSQILFVRDGYGPGDAVVANLHSERAEGGAPRNAKVSASALVDGVTVFTGTTTIDAHGDCSVSFVLPGEMARGDGTLAMVIEDGGSVETASKTIPILLQTLDLRLYPEGGDLVAGLAARVYVEGKTPAKKPADFQAVIVDEGGNEVAEVKTEHEGRGRFSLTPQAGHAYTLKVVTPSGIKTTYPLPAVKASGAVLMAALDVTPKGEPVRLEVGATKPGKYQLTISQREADVASDSFEIGKAGFFSKTLAAGELHERAIKLPDEADGVFIATLWDSSGQPVAERLVFRAPAKTLKVSVTALKQEYATGDSVDLKITTTDEDGKPVAAVAGITVSDESVVEMLEKREQPPRLPVMVYLEDEVQELADAHVYLDAANAAAPRAVDLMLGTQGWRRFALVKWDDFLRENGDKARRAIAFRVPPPPPPQAFEQAIPSAGIPSAAPMGNAAPLPPSVAFNAVPRSAPPPGRPAAAPHAAAPRPAPQLQAVAKDAMGAAPLASTAARQGGGVAGRRAMERQRRDDADEATQPRLSTFVIVREYAHTAAARRQPNERTDFADTVYWNAGVATDAFGEAKVRFALSDSVTTFRVAVDAFDQSGALGSASRGIRAVQPFYIEAKMPLQVTSHDLIKLPVTAVNSTRGGLQGASLSVSAAKGIAVTLPAGADKGLSFAAEARQRLLVGLDVGATTGTSEVVVAANAGAYADSVTRSLDVQPLGFPMEVGQGGLVERAAPASMVIDVPQSLVAGSLVAELAVFPSPLGNLTQALERLIREPCGCFEQTSSSNYPLIMAQQYFMTHSGVDPSLIERSKQSLRKGYDRLVGFECREKGYEWFGEDPFHEALSAYGLMEFIDMSKVFQVDMRMVDRTRQRLLSARDGKGGFTHARRALHTWLVEPNLHNGYITWALLESGERGIAREAKSFTEAALASSDSYVAALGANVAALSGDGAAANKLMTTLVGKQNKDGLVEGAKTSVVGSGGEALAIETTSLATLAWLRDPGFTASVEKGIRFLNKSCEGGRFGSTQSTVLALRAILAYDKLRAAQSAKGTVLEVLVDGKPVDKPLLVGAATQEAVKLPDITSFLKVGRHEVALKMKEGSQMPFSLAVRYFASQPDSSPSCNVGLETGLAAGKVLEGEVTEVSVTVRNLSDEAIPMPVAIIGLPGGLEVRHDQLKELKKAGRVSAYEVRGRDVVLYWRELAAKQEIKLPISAVAAVPGSFTGAASRAYQYYVDEHKKWVPGLKVEIAPRAER
jgi:alpha-2-macroglobulin-like protein